MSKKVFIAGILSAIAIFVIGYVFSSCSGYLYQEVSFLWKPFGSLWLLGIILFDVMVGLLYALIYTVVGIPIKGRWFDKGLLYGSLIWFLGPLPLIMLIHLMMVVPPLLILVWLLNWLMNVWAAGLITAYVFKGREKVKRREVRKRRRR